MSLTHGFLDSYSVLLPEGNHQNKLQFWLSFILQWFYFSSISFFKNCIVKENKKANTFLKQVFHSED